MKKARIWTGILILAGLLACLLRSISDSPQPRSGPVLGRIMYRGRPVTGGTIFFESEDNRLCEGTCTPIDETGHFECDPEWRRNPTGRTRFRISVILDPRKYPPESPSPRDEGLKTDGMIGPVLEQSTEARPVGTAVRASLGTSDVVSPSPIVEPGGRPALPPMRTTGLEVQLGPEPAQLYIEWKD
jgi:hypothetical protein